MSRILATIAASAAFIVAAYAGEIQGSVQSVDPASRTVILQDGSSYVAAEGVVLDDIEAGTQVRLTFDDSTMTAVQIEKL